MLQLQNTLTAAEITEWDSTGNVILSGLFSWWWKLKLDGYPESCTADVVMLEFEMYKHHLRRVDKRESCSWLSNISTAREAGYATARGRRIS